MQHAQTAPSHDAPRTRGGSHFVTWLRELEECRAGGLVSDEDFGFQRAEKLDELLQSPRCLWVGPLFGALVTGACGACATWWFTCDWRFTAFVALLAGLWGLTSLGRLFREKFIELQLRERMNILVALLDNDLISASELADCEDRLKEGNPGVL